MPDLVTLTIDGRQVEAPPGTLVIDAARRVGIDIPSFCYYEGLTLQAACRMCLVEVEKMPARGSGRDDGTDSTPESGSDDSWRWACSLWRGTMNMLHVLAPWQPTMKP